MALPLDLQTGTCGTQDVCGGNEARGFSLPVWQTDLLVNLTFLDERATLVARRSHNRVPHGRPRSGTSRCRLSSTTATYDSSSPSAEATSEKPPSGEVPVLTPFAFP